MTRSTRITLRDIAEYANVSVSTVSRALNNYHYVDEVTRNAIQEAADALEYSLENLRKPLVRNRKTVTLLTRNPGKLENYIDPNNNFELLSAMGVREELRKHQIDVIAKYIDMTDDDLEQIEAGCGIITMGGVIDPTFVENLQKHKITFVNLGSHLLPLRTNCIMADYMHGIQAAVDHLVAKGRQKIALVNGTSDTVTSHEKYNGLLLGLSRHGLSFMPEQVVSTHFNSAAGFRMTHVLLEQYTPDAIIYVDDNAAMGGMSALKEQSFIIPGDVSVIGFHNYEIGRFTDPPLTTVSFDMHMMGRMAAQRLHMMLENPEDTDQWMLLAPTELIVRGST